MIGTIEDHLEILEPGSCDCENLHDFQEREKESKHSYSRFESLKDGEGQRK